MSGAQTGSIHAASEGGYSGDHASASQLKALVGPTTEDQFNTLRLGLIPIACWRVDDIRFGFDSSFVVGDPDSDPTNPNDIRSELQHLLTMLKFHPGCPLTVFGHADPVGTDDHNKLLSGRRAMAIYALLIAGTDPDHAVKLWQQISATEHWGTGQRENMQATTGLDTGTPDSELFRAYLQNLCPPELKLGKSDFLAQGADPGGKGDFQGCSSFNPVLVFSEEEEQSFEQAARENDKAVLAERNTANADNRRVLVLIFRKGSRVDPAKWPCPRATEGVSGCHKRFFPEGEKNRTRRLPDTDRKFEDQKDNTFACRFYDRLASKSPCEGLYVPLIIRIVDIVEKPIVGMAYQLTLEDAQFSGNTSPDGLIAHKVDPDAKSGTLTLDGFEREVTIVPMEDSTAVAGAQARLSNLACGTDDAQEGILDDATQLALQRFQQRHGLTTSGQLDAATSAKLKDSYGS